MKKFNIFLLFFIVILPFTCYASEPSGYWELKEKKEVNNFNIQENDWCGNVIEIKEGYIHYYTSYASVCQLSYKICVEREIDIKNIDLYRP